MAIKNNKRVPDIIVLLRPTYPARKVEDIDKAIDIFIANFDQIDSLKSVVIADQSPFKMWSLKKDGRPLRLPKRAGHSNSK